MKRLAIALLLAIALPSCSGGCSSTSQAAPSPTPTAASFAGSTEIQSATQLAAKGQLWPAAADLAKGQRLLEEAAGLRINNLTVVSALAQGYGIYQPLAPPKLSIAKKQPLILYFEPGGFAHRPLPSGQWEFSLSAGVAAFAPAVSTTPFLSNPNFIKQQTLTSWHPNREMHLSATMHISGPPPGQYVAQVTLTDHVANKTVTATVPFELVP